MSFWLDAVDLLTNPQQWTLSRLALAFVKISVGNFLHEVFVTLEHAYQIVRGLDVSRGSYFQDNLDYESQSTKSYPEQSQFKNSPSRSIQMEDDKEKW